MSKSSIEWTETTWNPVTGCDKVSPGCKHCYAERMAHRLKAMEQPNYRNGFRVTLHEHMLRRPIEWKKPRMVFVNSMSDLFHESVPDDFILRVFHTMAESPQHTFQILTKRSKRILELDARISWPPNVWMGVSVENSKYAFRIRDLQKSGAIVKFLSLEPLLGPLDDLNLDYVNWVIAGGESGPHARPMQPEWVTSIRDQCQNRKVAFFFKQWGGKNKKKTGRLLEGRTWDEFPIFEDKESQSA